MSEESVDLTEQQLVVVRHLVAQIHRAEIELAALRAKADAVDRVRELHTPIEWQECDGDGVPDLDKPLTPFCRECTDDEYVSAVEFGDTIDRGSPVVDWPCATRRALDGPPC